MLGDGDQHEVSVPGVRCNDSCVSRELEQRQCETRLAARVRRSPGTGVQAANELRNIANNPAERISVASA